MVCRQRCVDKTRGTRIRWGIDVRSRNRGSPPREPTTEPQQSRTLVLILGVKCVVIILTPHVLTLMRMLVSIRHMPVRDLLGMGGFSHIRTHET